MGSGFLGTQNSGGFRVLRNGEPRRVPSSREPGTHLTICFYALLSLIKYSLTFLAAFQWVLGFPDFRVPRNGESGNPEIREPAEKPLKGSVNT
jgi:hypothetical protein